MSLTKNVDALLEAFEDIKREVKERSPRLYEEWKAGGFIIDDNIVSMYPNVIEVTEQLGDEDHDEDEEEDTANELDDIDPNPGHDPND